MFEKLFKWKHLTERETLLFKSFGILFIMAHNFFHLIKPMPSENEFSFTQAKFFSFLNLLVETPEDIVRISMSYLGHYGVQIFIFLSAYGLTRKYSQSTFNSLQFFKRRLIRIYPGFILAITLYLLAGFLFYGALGPIKVLYWKWDAILLKLLMISSYIPGQSLNPVGPWWFLPFIVSFYLIFPFLLNLMKKRGPLPILLIGAASYLPIIYLYPILLDQKINLYFMVLGHLPEFCVGMVIARENFNGKSLFPFFILALVVFLYGNLYYQAWFFSHLAAMILAIVFFRGLLRLVKKKSHFEDFFFFIGKISFHIFLVNGFTREPWSDYAASYNTWWISILFGLLSISISICVSYLLYKFENFLVTEFKRKLSEKKDREEMSLNQPLIS
jgi:peptidoglycan/LPS O-acetylase OafA/YrhL